MASADTPSEFISTAQAARQLGLSLGAVQQMVEHGKLVAWKTAGGHRRIRQDSVDALLSNTTQQPSAPTSMAIARPHGENLSVVILEDDLLLQTVYRETMAKWGLPLEIQMFDNGLDALLEVGRCMPDLLIADLRMSGLDGFQMIRRLRDNPATQDLPIVVVSVLTAEEVTAEGGLPDDVTVYGKPIPFRELHGYVQAQIARIRRQRNLRSGISQSSV
ncbi:MAG: response regulator [Azoarcus sp.]|jgi:excisionase family DNA binding protein|nr:response regulator [Azoarcus sp.]